MTEKTNVNDEKVLELKEVTNENKAPVTPEVKVKFWRNPKVKKVGKTVGVIFSGIGIYIAGILTGKALSGNSKNSEEYASNDYTVEYDENQEQVNE